MTTTIAMEDVVGGLEEDPVFLQALLTSYLENLSVGQGDLVAETGETPPASADIIKHLALIQLRDEDLGPDNRECCVCLDEHNVGDKVVRMPECSRACLFHPSCLVDWLQRKCTCPVCRYEYPTDDAAFEQERFDRMQQQKPRLARSEIGRLSHAELKDMLPENDPTRKEADSLSQDKLSAHLVESGVVEVVNRPEPLVEFSMAELRKMSHARLRSVTKDFGVFCLNPKDCTKKEDLIQVFISSGRLRVVSEPMEGSTGKNRGGAELKSVKGAPQLQQHSNQKQRKGLRKKIRHFFGTRK